MSNVGFNEAESQTVSSDFSPKRIERFLQIIDPYSNQKITFSECVHLLSSEMVMVPNPTLNSQVFHPSEANPANYDQEMIQVAILEHLSQNYANLGPPQSHHSEASTPVAMSDRN